MLAYSCVLFKHFLNHRCKLHIQILASTEILWRAAEHHRHRGLLPQALVSGKKKYTKSKVPRYHNNVRNRSFVKKSMSSRFSRFSTRRTPAWRNGLHHLKLWYLQNEGKKSHRKMMYKTTFTEPQQYNRLGPVGVTISFHQWNRKLACCCLAVKEKEEKL